MEGRGLPRPRMPRRAITNRTGRGEVVALELHPLVRHEWRDEHRLSMRSLIWIEQHADPGDVHPIVTAIAQLRDEDD